MAVVSAVNVELIAMASCIRSGSALGPNAFLISSDPARSPKFSLDRLTAPSLIYTKGNRAWNKLQRESYAFSQRDRSAEYKD